MVTSFVRFCLAGALLISAAGAFAADQPVPRAPPTWKRSADRPPTGRGLRFGVVTRNRGSRLWIISEEMSINMLTNPITQTPEGMRSPGGGRSTVIVLVCRSERLGPGTLQQARTSGKRTARRGASRASR